VDGIPEAVVHERNGLLFEAGDIATGAEFILRLVEDPERARRMGSAGRAAVAEFHQDRMLAEQEALYERLLGTT
jgi:glycosyltransferase involved in cell wall biosynthesis